MNFNSLKLAVAAALVLATNQAWAASVTIATPQLINPNYISFDVSPTAIGMLNVGWTKVNALDSSVVNSTLRSGGKYLTLSVGGMGLKSISYDDATRAILSVQYRDGFQFSADADDYITTGGSFSVSNLRLDLVEKRIYASVHGANGVGSLDGVALWTADTISGMTALPMLIPLLDGSGRVVIQPAFDARFSGLKLTGQGFDLWSQGMGYTDAGKEAMRATTNFGTISTSAVPEPGTCGLFIAGLAALGLAARRQRKHVH